MQIGLKIRELREAKHLSQGDIEKRTGLLRCYTSRVENGYTVPNVETLEKYARALEIPLYQFFTDGEPIKRLNLPASKNGLIWGENGKDAHEFRAFAKALSRMNDRQRKLLLSMTQKMAGGRTKR